MLPKDINSQATDSATQGERKAAVMGFAALGSTYHYQENPNITRQRSSGTTTKTLTPPTTTTTTTTVNNQKRPPNDDDVALAWQPPSQETQTRQPIQAKKAKQDAGALEREEAHVPAVANDSTLAVNMRGNQLSPLSTVDMDSNPIPQLPPHLELEACHHLLFHYLPHHNKQTTLTITPSHNNKSTTFTTSNSFSTTSPTTSTKLPPSILYQLFQLHYLPSTGLRF